MSYFEFHCHTAPYSKDAGATLESIIKKCEKQKVSSITITDHNEIEGALKLKSIAPDWLTVIIGEEINTSDGEIIGIFLKEKIQPGLSPRETLLEIKNQGGISVVPHPFDRFRRNVLTISELEKNIHSIDIIEIFNARNLLSVDNQKAEDFTKKHKKPIIYGSDAHFVGEYGRTVMSGIDSSAPEKFMRTLNQANFKFHKAHLLFHIFTKYMKIVNRMKK